MGRQPAEIRAVIVQQFGEVCEEEEIEVPELQDDTVLLETGLDSLGFAVVITRLEEVLGYDPFTEMDDPVYPQTLAELTEIYVAHEGSQD